MLHVLGVMDRGGAETQTVELMHQLRQSRYHLDVCTLSGRSGYYDEEIRDLGGKVLPCPLAPTITFPLRFMVLLRRGRYDIVHSHVHQFSGILLTLARLSGIRRRIAHVRSTSDGHGDTWSRQCYRRAMRTLMDLNASRIVGVSASTLHALWGPSWSGDRKKVVVYDGIDPSRYEPRWDRSETRRELNVSSDTDVIIHVGRFVPVKNHAALLRIAEALRSRRPRVVWLLAGDGPLRPSIERAVAERGLSEMVRLLGARSDVPRLLHASDVLVLPSLWEGLGDVVIEALAAGIPVVANPIPSVLEVAGHLPGIRTADSSDAAAFARAIDSVLKEPPSRRGLPLPPEFTARMSAERIVECYGG